jgi:hypothetical protein
LFCSLNIIRKRWGATVISEYRPVHATSEQGIGEHRVRRWLLTYPRAMPLALFLLVAAATALSVFAIERGARG